MYNYNFDEVSDKVKSSVEDLVKEEEVGFVVSGLMTIMNKLGLSSSDDFSSQNSSCFAHLSLKNPIAFSKNDFESLVSWDKELCENMKVIDFQLNALNKQKQVALNNFEISRVVALVDMINLLELDKLKYSSEVENVNNKIADIENKYQINYDDFSKRYVDAKDINAKNELEQSFDTCVILGYKINKIRNKFKELLENIDESKVELVKSSPRIKDVLGSYYFNVVGDDYVGADH